MCMAIIIPEVNAWIAKKSSRRPHFRVLHAAHLKAISITVILFNWKTSDASEAKAEKVRTFPHITWLSGCRIRLSVGQYAIIEGPFTPTIGLPQHDKQPVRLPVLLHADWMDLSLTTTRLPDVSASQFARPHFGI